MAKQKNKTGGNLSFEDKLYATADNYVLSIVLGKEFVDYIESNSAGNKMPRTDWKDMRCYPMAQPPVELAQAFQDYVAPLHKRIGLSVRQNRRFAGLRDTLLMELLSAELDLPTADQVEEVA